MSMMDTGRVLVADDQADVLEALRILLKAEGFEIATADSPPRILSIIEQADFDAVLMDSSTSTRSFLSARRSARWLPMNPAAPVIRTFRPERCTTTSLRPARGAGDRE